MFSLDCTDKALWDMEGSEITLNGWLSPSPLWSLGWGHVPDTETDREQLWRNKLVGEERPAVGLNSTTGAGACSLTFGPPFPHLEKRKVECLSRFSNRTITGVHLGNVGRRVLRTQKSYSNIRDGCDLTFHLSCLYYV